MTVLSGRNGYYYQVVIKSNRSRLLPYTYFSGQKEKTTDTTHQPRSSRNRPQWGSWDSLFSSSSSSFSHQYISFHHFSWSTVIPYSLIWTKWHGRQCAIASIVLAAFSAAWAIGRTVGKFHFFICLQTYSVGIVYFSALTPHPWTDRRSRL